MTPDEIGTPAADAHEAAVVETVAKGPRSVETTREKVERWILYFVLAAVFVVGPAVYLTYRFAHATDSSLHTQCRFYYGVALVSGPTIPKQTTAVGLAILSGGRVAYEGLGCTPPQGQPQIPPAAPAVAAVLPPGFH